MFGEREFNRQQLLSHNLVHDQWRYEPRDVDRGLDDYEYILPKYERLLSDKGFVDILADRIKRNGRAVVLDIGCGTGSALVGLKERFGKRLETWGISASDFRKPETEGKIDHYLVDDVHSEETSEKVPENHFDVIVAVQSFIHLADPLLVLERSWDWLDVGGIGFVDSVGRGGLPVYWNEEKLPHEMLIELLRDHGYSFQRGRDERLAGLGFPVHELHNIRSSFVFKKDKNRPRLYLPVEYDGVDDAVFQNDVRVLRYRWVEQMPEKIARRIV